MVIRPAVLADAAGIASAQVKSWRTTYRGIIPNRYLDSMSVAGHEKMWRAHLHPAGNITSSLDAGTRIIPGPSGDIVVPWTVTLVAETREAGIVGFIEGGPEREGVPGYDVELNALYLVQEWQRSGLGRKLVRAFVDGLRPRRVRSMIVWALAANPARSFYEALGGVEIAREPDLIGATVLEKVAYGWPDIAVLAI